MKNETLEQQLEQSFKELDISDDAKSKFISYLDILSNKDPATWEHSIRVGLLSRKIAEYTHEDPKALFLPGIVHDVGKALIDSSILRKTVGFNSKDKKLMDFHPIYGYKLLESVCPFSALVSFYHHYFGINGYPNERNLPKISIPFSEDSKHWARECARKVAIADFWDAATHRKNNKYSEDKPVLMSRDEAYEILMKNSGSRKHLVKSLYSGGILL